MLVRINDYTSKMYNVTSSEYHREVFWPLFLIHMYKLNTFYPPSYHAIECA